MIFCVSGVIATINQLKINYWSLIKGRQTFLLTMTGLAGYLCLPVRPTNGVDVLGLVGSLILTISGSTTLNMLIDRDIDAKMSRTKQRPLANGQIRTQPVRFLGIAMLIVGLVWSTLLSPLYFTIILVGAGVNILVYTLWLKRRSPWSILWGGIAGGMPILAGRVLASSRIDMIAILLALVIICWIPGHNLTLNMLYESDYLNAEIPTVLNVYGPKVTHIIIDISSLLVAVLTTVLAVYLQFSLFLLAWIVVVNFGLVGLSLFTWINHSKEVKIILFKYISLYMLVFSAFLILSGIH
jgi:protoheme IX farnesyltransferase